MIRQLLLLASLPALFACAGSDAPGTSLKEVPRERTMILDCLTFSVCAGQIKDYNTFNPYIPGNTAPTGWNFLYEPLYFYNAFKEEDNIIPWIATGHQYNVDYTEVTVKIRPGVEWSDGRPWTVRDFVFTINMLKSNAPDLLFSTDMQLSLIHISEPTRPY